MTDHSDRTQAFPAEVRSRFGVLPNFFCTAAAAPGLIEKMWGFAKSAYLDSPLPSLFKERLFVHLSRFCEIRYCIIRHVGFLVGHGNPAGDPSAKPETIEQVIGLLRRPVADAKRLELALAQLESVAAAELPGPESELEGPLFDALTVLFIEPRDSQRTRLAIGRAFGETNLEMLTAFLAFVRTAHYWTETHPTLGCESDVIELMRKHPQLEKLLLDTSEAEWAQSSQRLRRALDDLRVTSGALRSTEERFRALVLATSDVLYRVSPDWAEMRWLDGRGLLSDTTTPDTAWMERYIPPEDSEALAEAIHRSVITKTVFELEHRVIGIDGKLRWVMSRAVPILDDKGEVAEWFGAIIDVTARRNAEEVLRHADRRKDEFLATLAHELRNPLAPLRNGLQIARLHGPSHPTLERTINMMDRQVNMLIHLVDDLLDVSRITSGKIQLRRSDFKLREVLAASAEASRSIVDSHRHLLLIEPCPEEIKVDGDFDRLVQIFANLLNNAAKYTEDGGTIQLRVRQQADEVAVSISDTGIGIPPDDLMRIFDIFSQVQSHRGRAAGGLGIGLSLVRQLVSMHGGSVRAESPGAGQGSTFTVRLPLLIQAKTAPDPVEGTSVRASISGRRVLIVDDNVDSAASLAIILEHLGHEVRTANSGEAGIAMARAFNPNVAILDLGMPEMDGIETARRLRALPEAAQTTLIALTGWGQAEDLQRAKEVGFDHHVLKPVDLDSLQQLLSSRGATPPN